MLSLNSVIIFSENPKSLASFYKEVIKSDADWKGGDFVGFKAGNGHLIIGPHSKVKGKNKNPERIMINFDTEDVEGKFKRIKNIKGAKVISDPYNPEEDSTMTIATLSDPDGNFFQLNSPM